MNEHFNEEVFNATARLDLPTSDDKVVKGKLKGITDGPQGSRYGVVWGSLSIIFGLFFSTARLVAELGLLAKVVSDQRDGVYFAIVLVGQELLKLILAPDWGFSRAYG